MNIYEYQKYCHLGELLKDYGVKSSDELLREYPLLKNAFEALNCENYRHPLAVWFDSDADSYCIQPLHLTPEALKTLTNRSTDYEH